MKHSLPRILTFVALILLGFALLPRLPFQLQPSRTLPSLTVSYAWANTSGELLERQVTSKLEAIFATLRGLENITSTTRKGSGSIRLSFDKETNLDYMRFEVSALIRQAIPSLPEQLSYPQIQRNRPREDADPTLMSFTLNGPVSPYHIRQYAEEFVQPRLSLISGVHQIELYGASPYAWELTYDQDQLQQLGVKRADVEKALERWFYEGEIGVVGGNKGVGGVRGGDHSIMRYVLEGETEDLDWSVVPVSRVGNRIIYLTDVVEVQRRERPATGYHRVNGLNTINMTISAEASANHLEVADQLREEVENLKADLPPNYSLILTYDSTEFLKEELEKIGWRSVFSVVILLLFVWIVSRSIRYLGIIIFSLVANLAIACLFYYILGLEIHLYSLAGITVSLGLIIDNSIVMIDHLRRERNLRVFLGILAATLTTLGALSIIMFLEENQRLLLQDFAWVMMINLGVSLAVALWLIPALVSPKEEGKHKGSSKPKRVGWWRTGRGGLAALHCATKIFGYFSSHGKVTKNKIQRGNKRSRLFFKLRPLFLTLAILAFGLPTFLLPDKWETEAQKNYYGPKEDEPKAPWYINWYNESLGSTTYVQDIKPWADKLLGGTLRLFIEETYPNSRYNEPERTALYVNGEMPYGTNIHQMNEVFEGLENFLTQYEEIEQFQSDIRSPQSARMVIYFKPEHDKTSFPYILKSRVERFAIDQGAVDWSVYGVGRGFNNSIGVGGKNSRITLRGYNYDELFSYAERVKDSLLANPRIKEVFLNGEHRWDYRPNFEYVMDMDKGRLAEQNTNPEETFRFLQTMTMDERPLMYTYMGGNYEQIILKPKQAKTFDVWQVNHYPLQNSDSTTFKLQEAANIVKEPAGDIIYRENQQYRLLVEYDFIGPYQLQRRVKERMTDAANDWLPLGYIAESSGYGGWNREAEKKQYWLIFLVIAIIYVICAILLESLWQPLAIISMIPISFIGLFLTFYLFEFNFDQGGYAAFLVLSGISVNAALYIVHEYNGLRKKGGKGIGGIREIGAVGEDHDRKPSTILYWQAFRNKITPISLTVLSTVLGLIPFVWAGQDEPFWFALAVGTIGGLFFSMVGIVVYLPLLILRKSH